MDTAYAQTVAKAAGPSTAGGAFLQLFVTMVLPIMVLYYFFFILPQGKDKKKRDEMLGGIQRGDRVLTRGGLFGTVADIREDVLILKISENSKVEVDRNYIETVQKNG
jgi:preprotein translocase subunit YajC